jgi:hypothetical protein
MRYVPLKVPETGNSVIESNTVAALKPELLISVVKLLTLEFINIIVTADKLGLKIVQLKLVSVPADASIYGAAIEV